MGLSISIDKEKQEELRNKAHNRQLFNTLIFGAKLPYSEVKTLTLAEAWELYYMYEAYCEDRNEAEKRMIDEAKRQANAEHSNQFKR